ASVLPTVERDSLAAIILGDRAIIRDNDEGSPFVQRMGSTRTRSNSVNGAEAISQIRAVARNLQPAVPAQSGGNVRETAAAAVPSPASPAKSRAAQGTAFSFGRRAATGSPVDFNSALDAGLRIRGKAVSLTDDTGKTGATGDITFETAPELTSKRGIGFSGTFARQMNGSNLSEAMSVKFNAAPTGALKLNSEFATKGVNGRRDESTASVGFETSQDWKKRSRLGFAGGFSRQEKGVSSVNTANLRFDANPFKGFMLKGDFQNKDGSVEERTSRIGFETSPDMRKVANLYMSGTFTRQENAGTQGGVMNLKMEVSPLKTLALKGEINDEQSSTGAYKRVSKLLATTSVLRYMDITGNCQMLEQNGGVEQRLINVDFKSNNKLINWRGLAMSGKYTSKDDGLYDNRMLNLRTSLNPFKRMTLAAGLALGETSGNQEATRNLKLGYNLPNLGQFQADAVVAERYTGDTANGAVRLNMAPWRDTKVNLQYTVKPYLLGSNPLITTGMDFNTKLSRTFSLYGGLKKDEISNDRFTNETLLGIKTALSPQLNLAADYRLQSTDGSNPVVVRGVHIQDSIHKRVTLLFGLEQAVRSDSAVMGSYTGVTSNPFGKVNLSYKHRLNTGNGTLANLPKEEFKVSAPMAKTANKNLEINGNIYYVDQEVYSNNKLSGNLNLTYRPMERLNLTASYVANVAAGQVITAPCLTWEACYGTEF
ncbi:MAG: hypothetical protein PHT33_08365, partial [bacterium]|nr:hypothetical protein [bacterium]